MLTRRFKEAFKTALAMTIAIGIALALNWDKPSWAAFAVAFISLNTVGQSLQKGVYRIGGTLLAVVVALLLIALFPQDRWLLLFFLSLHFAVCTYMMGISERPYFWQAAGFIAGIITLEAGPDAVNAFNTAIMRGQETLLGVLVYTVISALIWPSESRGEMESAAGSLSGALRRHLTFGMGLMTGRSDESDHEMLKAAVIQLNRNFRTLLKAAEYDSYEVWEVRHAWHRCRDQIQDVASILARWCDGLEDADFTDFERVIPGIRSAEQAFDQRLEQIEGLLRGETHEAHEIEITLDINVAAVDSLKHFERAAVSIIIEQLRDLDRSTAALFATACDIRGLEIKNVPDWTPRRVTSTTPIFDPEGFMAAVRMMSIHWMAFLAIIYVPDFPGGYMAAIMSGALGLVVVTAPQMPIRALLRPAWTSVLFAGVVYMFVMPHLVGYAQLGAMIFAVTFAICFLFSDPRAALGRSFGLAMFVSITGITNDDQTYSFLSFANTALVLPITFSILAFSAYFPFDWRAEVKFERQLARFFSSCEYLMSTTGRDTSSKTTFVQAILKAFHVHQIKTIPQGLGGWSKALSPDALTDTSRDEVKSLLIGVQALAFRVQELLDASALQQSEKVVDAMLLDIRAWRLNIQTQLGSLSRDPTSVEAEVLKSKHDETVLSLEALIRDTLEQVGEGRLSQTDGRNMYRMLGALRNISDALVMVSGHVQKTDWHRFHEARF